MNKNVNKNKKIFSIIFYLIVLTLINFTLVGCDYLNFITPVNDEHICSHVCPICGNCTDFKCTNLVCANKCSGHENPAPHVCAHICSQCGKCTDVTCLDEVCKNKCPGHNIIPGEFVVSDYYDGYYTSIVSWINGEDLKLQLHNLISNNYNKLTYEGNWDSNGTADRSLIDFEFVDAIYSSDDIEMVLTGNLGWNREHCFCASLMTGLGTGEAVETKGRATDFHNLYASGQSGNQSRGNKNFGEAGNTGYDSYISGTVFEPGDKDKGIVARAIFYMCTMYMPYNQDGTSEVDGLKGLTVQEEVVDYTYEREHGGYQSYAIGNLSTLLDWNDFAVSRGEYQHNYQVYSHISQKDNVAQGNRNPFVDYPELVEYVFGSKKDEPGELKYLVPTYETLNLDSDEICNYAIENAKRNFDNNEVFDYSDIKVVSVKYNFEEENYLDFNVLDHIDDSILSCNGDQLFEIVTPDGFDNIKYKVNVHTDEVEASNYNYEFKTTDFNGAANSYNNITLSDKTFKYRYSSASKFSPSLNKQVGVQIGTAKNSVCELILESTSTFENIKTVYLRGSAAAKSSVSVSLYVNDVLIETKVLGAVSGITEPLTLDFALQEAKNGTIKIVIKNDAAKAFYLKNLAVDNK